MPSRYASPSQSSSSVPVTPPPPQPRPHAPQQGNFKNEANGGPPPAPRSQPVNGNSIGTTRHRASRAGTRCVSKLSTAQLARKRANDREAQRAIRQRTKEHIENLERRIEELTDPSKDLKMMFDIQQRNRELEEEIRQLKEQMAQMTVQNTMNQLGQGDAMSGQWPILNMPFEQGGSGFLPDGGNGMLGVKLGTDAASGPSTASSLYTGADPNSPLYPEMGNSSGGFPDLNATTAAFPLTPGNPDNLGLRSDLTPQRSWIPPGTSSFATKSEQNPFSPPTGPATFSQQPNNSNFQYVPYLRGPPPSGSTSQAPTSAPMSSPSPMPQLPMSSTATTSGSPPSPTLSPAPMNPTTVPAWAQAPRVLPPTSRIDTLLQTALLTHRSAMLAGSANPTMPDTAPLLNLPTSSPTAALNTAIVTAMNAAGFVGSATRAAVLYTTHAVLRWQINPLPDTFAHVPEWLRPVRAQIDIPHVLWASQLAWPGLRDVVIRNQGNWVSDEFVCCYARNLDVGWPFGEEGIFKQLSESEGGGWGLEEGFVRHLRGLGAWSLGEEFREKWGPGLGDLVRWREGRRLC